MPVGLKLTVMCDGCGATRELRSHDRGDFQGEIDGLEAEGWKVNDECSCPDCRRKEAMERGWAGPSLSPEMTRQPTDERSENIDTMSVRRCGEIARMLGFRIHITRTLGDEEGLEGVWGVMVISNDGSEVDMSLARFVDEFPSYWIVNHMVRDALTCGIEKFCGSILTRDDASPSDYEARNIIRIPLDCREEWMILKDRR